MAQESVAAETWDLSRADLWVREQATVRASDAFVAEFPSQLWEPLGLTVARPPGDPSWTIRASDRVGLVRVDVAGTQAQLRVTPKLPDLDLFFLADWAYGSTSTAKRLLDGRAELDAIRSEPAACLLAWYLAEAVAFATRWVRRGYISRDQDLVGRVRGRIDVARYVSRSLTSAQPHVVPCHFFEPSHNTLPNQYLKAGVRRAAALARVITNPYARQFILELSHRGLALLAAVDDVEFTAQQGRRLNLAGPMRHYRPIASFTTALLDGTYLSTQPGSHAQEAILWPLNTMYEQALRNVLAEWPGGRLEPAPQLQASVIGVDGTRLGGSRVTPDFVLSVPGRRLALDAKYKEVLATDDPGQPNVDAVEVAPTRRVRVRVRRSDIYQAVAYGRHDRLRPCAVGLIYPVTLQRDEPLPAPVHVDGFDPAVHVIFFDTGPHASAHLDGFYGVLDSLADLNASKGA